MKTEGINLLLITIPVFWSSFMWPRATEMSSRMQRNIPLDGRYRQVSLYIIRPYVPNISTPSVRHSPKVLHIFEDNNFIFQLFHCGYIHKALYDSVLLKTIQPTVIFMERNSNARWCTTWNFNIKIRCRAVACRFYVPWYWSGRTDTGLALPTMA